MPVRKTPLITGEIYHVFNHGIDYRDICQNNREYQHFLLTLWFYQPSILQMKLSHYLSLATDARIQLIPEISSKPKYVEIQAFSLLPNHYHLVIKQIVDKGISTFVGNVQNSYTKYYNKKHHRRGSLFLTPFRARHVYTEAQFLHVCRYVHLNHYSSGLISNLDRLKVSPLTSLPYYLNPLTQPREIVSRTQLEQLFASPQTHWKFIRDQADYQRQLDHIKHLIEE